MDNWLFLHGEKVIYYITYILAKTKKMQNADFNIVIINPSGFEDILLKIGHIGNVQLYVEGEIIRRGNCSFIP